MSKPIGAIPFCILLLAQLAAGPATRPADPKEVIAAAERLLAQGINSLWAEAPTSAVPVLLDARQLLQTAKLGNADDAVEANVLHALAVAYMMTDRWDQAREHIDRAYALDGRNGELLFNRANLDLVQKVTVMRAIKEVKEALERGAEPLEPLLNVLGSSLSVAADNERYVETPLFKDAMKTYEEYNRKLEDRTPGQQRRWGVDWESASTVERKLQEFRDAQASLNRARQAYNATARELQAAEKELNRRKRQAEFKARFGDGGVGGSSGVASAERRRDELREQLSRHKADIDQARRAMPRINWPDRYKPIIPSYDAKPSANDRREPVADSGKPAPPEPREQPRQDRDDRPVVVRSDDPAAQEPAPRAERRTVVTEYGVAFPIAADVLVAPLAVVGEAELIQLQSPSGHAYEASVIKTDAALGLALVRVKDAKLAWHTLADSFDGGAVRCAGFPEVSIFEPSAQHIDGRSAAPRAPWTVTLSRHPRLSGSPLLSADGRVVGVVLCDRDTPPSKLPAVTFDALRAFCGEHAARTRSPQTDPLGVYQIIATRGG
jgi:tetratricopeptide (TPR) repeat protein